MLSCLHMISLAAIEGSGCGEEVGELVDLREGSAGVQLRDGR